MSEPRVAIGDAVLDGWALAAALDGGAQAASACAPAFARALAERLEALRAPDTKVAALRAWSARLRPPVGADVLAAARPRVRALLAPLASPEARAGAAPALADLPAPRRGYRPPPGMAAGLATRAARGATRAPSDADRGLGRRTLAGLMAEGEGRERAAALLAEAGAEADAVERLAALAGGEPDSDPIVPFALEAAVGHPDPVGRFGQLLGGADAAARELRELEAACRA